MQQVGASIFEVLQTGQIYNVAASLQSYPGQQTHPMPPECSLQVLGFTPDGTPVRAGLLTESSSQTSTTTPTPTPTPTPIYVRGEKVRVVPLRKENDPIRVDSAADSKHDAKPRVGNGEAYETAHATNLARDELDALTPGAPAAVVDLGALPDADADAKLERLPSNTPVLRAWGEAAGVEQRWRSRSRSASDADAHDTPDAHGVGGMAAISGASYVSNAATVEVADSDADSKDESFSNSNTSPTSSLRDGTWSRYSTLDDVIATALPMLSAVSSDISDAERPGLRSVAAAATGSSTSMMISASPTDDLIHGAHADAAAAGAEGDGGVSGGGQDEKKRHDLADYSKPGACSSAKDTAETLEECPGDGAVGLERSSSTTLPWTWAVRVQAAAMPRKARLRLYLEKRSSLPSRGPTLEEAREFMTAWTPEMDKSLLELLGAAGTKAVSYFFSRGRSFGLSGILLLVVLWSF